MDTISRKKIYIGIIITAVIIAAGFALSKIGKKDIEISGGLIDKMGSGLPLISKSNEKSPITGIECATANARPFAVMISSDKEALPLSGIGEADMVFEMPVVNNGFTRMMAVFQCGRPKELGSVRSSRLDFIPLALGLDAIYAHFGGEHTALEELNSGIINNVDGLKYDGTIYYRKNNIPKPHNAFTNFTLLDKVVSELGYSTKNSDLSYPHEKNSKSLDQVTPTAIYDAPFKVIWTYNKSSNSYFRTRAGLSEIDKNTGKQVEAKNVVIMKTTWSPINKDYIRVKTVGSGGALFYKDGQVFNGSWEKKNDKAKLYFYNANHKEIEFAPGNVWVEITTN
jgi:hypothetical protein